ncbi:MAG: hypothetical protein HYW33_03215 [Candidatus Blackburnbacteria bacterium]|nr:hypothetical protein [Candidatus Blackburnbacteria bacterium]
MRGVARYFLTPVLIIIWIMTGFILGYLTGIFQVSQVAFGREQKLADEFTKLLESAKSASATPTSNPQQKPSQVKLPRTNYTGPELWAAVNEARVEHGVQALSQRDVLCTIAAIRLSNIRSLGKLDNHDGFQATYDKYKDNPNMPNNVSEFLISGYPTPNEAVEAWLDTLGHKKLITGGEYVWGCVYAQDGFGVAITGY